MSVIVDRDAELGASAAPTFNIGVRLREASPKCCCPLSLLTHGSAEPSKDEVIARCADWMAQASRTSCPTTQVLLSL
jgi:hypothetical protein